MALRPWRKQTTWQGQWNNAGTNYDLSLNGKSMTAHTDGLRLTI